PPVTGSPLTLGTTVMGTISVAGEQDTYTFTLATDAQLSFDSQTNSLNLRWTLTGPAGAAVSNQPFNRSDAGDETGDSILRLPAGDYVLTINGAGNATGSYQFKMQDLAAALQLTPGTPVAGQLAPANETDFYQFTAAAGERFYFDLQERTG